MHAIIAGCGRVGAHVATALVEDGHDVVVIDKDPRAFARLGADFAGRTVTGIVFDQVALEEAKIRKAQVFVAVTSGDNSNIVSARTARERYGVDRVVARIYDPRRAEIFERMGVQIVASARWTAERLLGLVSPEDGHLQEPLGGGSGDVVLATFRVPDGVRGQAPDGLSRPGHSVLAAITRAGNTVVPPPGALLEAGDLVHLSVERASLEAVRKTVASLRTEH
jgi:trk system potassium uptake protein TrkA